MSFQSEHKVKNLQKYFNDLHDITEKNFEIINLIIKMIIEMVIEMKIKSACVTEV